MVTFLYSQQNYYILVQKVTFPMRIRKTSENMIFATIRRLPKKKKILKKYGLLLYPMSERFGGSFIAFRTVSALTVSLPVKR